MSLKHQQNRIPLLICLLTAGLMMSSHASAAAIKCWKNKDGVRECGAMVPPEYAQQRIEVLNTKGQVVKVLPRAKTDEELKADAEEEKRRKQQARRQAELKRRDLILLRTFTTERDIELSRKGKIDAIKGIIEITNSNTRALEDNLLDLQKRAADYERSGEKPPQVLIDDMQNLNSQIKDNEAFVLKKQQAILEIDKKYEADLARFRELKKPRQH